MKVLKVMAAIILSVILLAVQTAALTLKAVKDSMTAEAISEAFIKTYQMSAITAGLKTPVLMAGLYDSDTTGGFEMTTEDMEDIKEALGQGDIAAALSDLIKENADRLGIDPSDSDEIAAEILKTDAAADFIGKYSSGLINAAVYGSQTADMGSGDVINLVDSVISELPADMQEGIDKEAVRSYITEAAPSISEQFNSTVTEAADSAVWAENNVHIEPQTVKALRFALSGVMFAILLVISLIIGILLISMFFKTKAGFIWWAVVSILTALPFLLLRPASVFAFYKLPQYSAVSLLLKPLINKLSVYGVYVIGFAVLLIVINMILRYAAKSTMQKAANV